MTPVSPALLAGFRWYLRRHLRRHFHALRLLGEPPAVPPGAPLVVYLNHPGWWDPLVALHLAHELYPDRSHHGPIDAAMLERYRLFARLGFFGVEQGTTGGARAFLRVARAVLAGSGTGLWLTPQGGFADPRRRPPALAPGLAHLARWAVREAPQARFVPLALEYPFWSERLPEALAAFGEPLVAGELEAARRPPVSRVEPSSAGGALRRGDSAAGERERGAREHLFADRLAAAQDRLAVAAVERDTARFTTLLAGGAGMVGASGLYDRWRRLVARLAGERFGREHGSGAPR